MRVNRLNFSMKFRLLLCTLIPVSMLLLYGCGGPASSENGLGQSAEGLPELTDEIIRERLNGVRFGPIPEETGQSEPISWRFFEDEPKEITIVEKNIQGTSATVTLDIKTRSTLRSREPRQLAGQVRLEWELRSGMVLRRWEVVGTENLSVRYKNLPKPSPLSPDTGSSQAP